MSGTLTSRQRSEPSTGAPGQLPQSRLLRELSPALPRSVLTFLALLVLALPAFGQATAIQPCTQTTNPPRARLLSVDNSVPADPDVEKLITPYSEKVRELSKVIGRLDGGLSKKGVGAGTLGNFVSDGMRAQAKAKLGKPVTLAIMNGGGLRKNDIAAGDLRASDIFELLPFENALVALEVTGVQLAKIIEVVTKDAQSGARIHFKYNDRDRPEFISGKLLDENGNEQDIDPNKMYTIVTIDYLVRLKSGAYTVLQEAKSSKPLDITLRDAVMDYVKSETAAGRSIHVAADNRFIQVGPGPKSTEPPR
ncbi:MAG TPA: 5'-nucleotidase C-terminal domain-containing protein [Pyrinomonadaceae bacterium]|nr:5'-nucleotidase C-terminal domain-containing protein [Pyrinomonadaceae bacterium]